MKNLRGYLVIFTVLGFLCSGLSLLHAAEEKMIQIKGSDTMVNLSQAWAEEFMKENPNSSIAVTGGGSGTGISADQWDDRHR